MHQVKDRDDQTLIKSKIPITYFLQETHLKYKFAYNSKSLEKMHKNSNHQKARVTILTSDKVDLSIKNINSSKGDHF